MLCVVDDAQWLDQSSALTLAFVARRLLAEPVGLVFAVREPGDQLRHLPELAVAGLRNDDARALLSSAVRFRLDEQVRDRIVAETRGNPLALLELPRDLSATELAGFGTGAVSALSDGIEESFRRRLAALPEETRRLLLIAAADPLGEPTVVWRAAELQGIRPAGGGACGRGGAVRVRRSCPVPASARPRRGVRGGASDERRRAHAAIAEVTDAEADPDRRAWHRALASAGPDEAVADELERSAVRARARGGQAAAAAFLERAVDLTLDPTRRAERALAAAEAKYLAGSAEDALRLAAVAERGPLNEFHRARVDVLRGRVATMQRRAGDAPPLLLGAARRLERFDRGVARETYRDAFIAAVYAGRFAGETGLPEVAAAVRSAAPSTEPPSATDELLDAAALLIDAGWAAGAGAGTACACRFPCRADLAGARPALALFRQPHVPSTCGMRTLGMPSAAGCSSWCATPACSHCCRWRPRVRVGWELFAGDLAAASELVVEQDTIQEAIGGDRSPGSRIALAAFRGREAEVAQLDEATTRDAVARGDGAVGELAPLVDCRSLQRPRPLRRGTRRRAARSRVSARPARVELGAQRARRGSGALRPARGGQRRARAAGRDGARVRHRLGPRRRGARSRARGGRRRRGRSFTATRSSVSGAHGSAPNSRARACSTASGCAARGAASTRACSCAPRTTSSRRSGWRRSPSVPARELQATGEKVTQAHASRHATI